MGDKGWLDAIPANQGGTCAWSAEFGPDVTLGIELQNAGAVNPSVTFTLSSSGYSRTMQGITETFNGIVWTKTPGYDNRWEIQLDCR